MEEYRLLGREVFREQPFTSHIAITLTGGVIRNMGLGPRAPIEKGQHKQSPHQNFNQKVIEVIRFEISQFASLHRRLCFVEKVGGIPSQFV